MKKLLLILFLLSVGVVLPSCGGDSSPTPLIVPVSGWIIGASTDSVTQEPTVKILKTVNGGASWVLQTLPDSCVGFTGNDISAVNHAVAWAAIGDSQILEGGILHTGDGGATWTLQSLPDGMGNRHMKSIKGVSPAEAWAASIRGDVLHTTDGGNHWDIVELKREDGSIISVQQVNRMDVTGRDIWIVDSLGGNYGVIHSPDGGATWRQEYLPELGQGGGPLAISAFDSLVAWAAVNSEGYLWSTSDGGGSWSRSTDSIAGTADFDDICASSANVVWVAQNNGLSSGGVAARVTVTDGAFETNSFSDVNYTMEGISALSDNRTAWLVGMKTLFAAAELPRGVIYHTRDGGKTWKQQSVPDNARDVNFWKVSFVGARR